jgi:agmatine deiminase
LGYAMPAEWEKHEATWLGWPHNPTDWPDKLDTIRWVYGEMVRKIAPGERVRILVRNAAEQQLARRYLQRAGADLRRVQFIVHPTNRGWTRDSGPIFVRRRVKGRSDTAIVHFHFNAWAKYPDWQKDRRVPETAARLCANGSSTPNAAAGTSSLKAAALKSTAPERCSPRRNVISIRRCRCATPASAAARSKTRSSGTWG